MIADQPPTDLLQSALDHAYARGWHDGFIAGRKEHRASDPKADLIHATARNVEALLEALQFYADETSYYLRAGDVLDDNGERARLALARHAGDGETTE